MKKFAILAVLPALMMMPACADNIDSSHYESSSVGQAASAQRGTVISVRRINVSTTNGVAGTLLGAGAGAALGSMIGGSDGVRVASGIGGAAIGGIAGNKAQEGLSSQGGYEYVVELDSGRIVTVTQGEDTLLVPGDRCLVTFGNRARVIPAR